MKKNKKPKKNNNNLYKSILNDVTYIYLTIPIIIFLLGWVKLWIGIPLTILLILSVITRIIKYKSEGLNIKKYISNHWREILITLSIVATIVFLSGIGAFVFQNDDHVYRNTIFTDLITNKWPIYISANWIYHKDVIMVYYFALWLPASIIGKMFGIESGFIALYIWCVIGVYITMRYFKLYYKKNYLIPIILFIGFSGLDIIEQLLYGHNILELILNSAHIEWTTGYQFSSFMTQLFWVFNQAIPAWLLTLVILNEKDTKKLLILFSYSLLYCTLPTVGLFFVAIYKLYFSNNEKLNIQKIINKTKEVFSWENIIIGIPLFMIIATYITSNSLSGTIKFGVPLQSVIPVIVTIIFEFLIYYYLVFKYKEEKKLAIISLIILLICPFVSINGGGDFCMRASIPSLVVLFLLLLKTIPKMSKKDLKLFIIIFLLGTITPLNEITRTITQTNMHLKRKSTILIVSPCSQNFYGYKDESLFVKYFAKSK